MRIFQSVKSSLVISLGVLMGRGLGYIRELLIASQFGISETADQILLILNAPDLFNNLLSFSALSLALFPVLKTEVNQVVSVARFCSLLLFLAGIFYLMFGVLAIFVPVEQKQFYFFLAISLLCIFPNSVNAVLVSYLQFNRRFALGSLGSLLFNLVFVFFLLVFSDLSLLALGVVAGAFVRLCLAIYDCWIGGLRLPSLKECLQARYHLISTFRILVVPVMVSGLVLVVPVIDKCFAGFVGEGSVALLAYGEKLYLLPMAIFLMPFCIALAPELHRLDLDSTSVDLSNFLFKSMPIALGLSTMLSCVLWFLSDEIVEATFGYVELSDASLNGISSVFNSYLGALIFSAPLTMFTHLLFALEQFRVALLYCTLFFILKIVWNIGVLYAVFDGVFGNRAAAFAGGTSLLVIVSGTLLYFFLCHRAKVKVQTW